MRLHHLRGTNSFCFAEPVATSPRNRRCAEPGCHVRLSVYNHGRYCALHESCEVMGPAKACNKCGEIKELSEEFWHHDNYNLSGWHPICKACRSAVGRATYRERRRLNERVTKDALCRQCDETQPRDADHFSFGAKGRLVQPCLRCQEQNRKRRAARTLDSYYRRKYHMTRDEYLAGNPGGRAVVVIGRGGRENWTEVAP